MVLGAIAGSLVDPDPWIPGQLDQSDLVSIVAVATSTTVYTPPTAVNFRLLGVRWMNRAAAGSSLLSLGETIAAAFTQRIPNILMIPNIDGFAGLAEMVWRFFESALIARASAAGAADNDVQIVAFVKVYSV